jgi:hypothetical protein
MEKYKAHEQGRYKPLAPTRPLPDDNWPYPRHPNNGNDTLYGNKSPKFERHLYILKDQILYDIEAQIAIISSARRNEQGQEDDKLSSATTTYKTLFQRWIEKHIGIAKSTMSAFVLERFKTTSTNIVKNKDEVDIELLMPEWYDDTVFEQLTQAVQEYVVNATLFEFLTLTLTSKDPVTVDKKVIADETLNDIRKYVNAAKPGRIKKPFNPF